MSQQTIHYARPLIRRNILVMLVSRRARRMLAYTIVLSLCYLGSYVVLSACGKYEPALIGPNGVKDYCWAPAGFVKNYRQHVAAFYVYMPLWFVDRSFWHRDNDAYGGKYPVHVPRNIDEVYAAWR